MPGPGAVEVQLHLGPGAQWVPESVPVRGIGRRPDGTVTDVLLDVAGMAWFERLLLQLGPDAFVVRPPELTDLAARAARKVLSVYAEKPKKHYEPSVDRTMESRGRDVFPKEVGARNPPPDLSGSRLLPGGPRGGTAVTGTAGRRAGALDRTGGRRAWLAWRPHDGAGGGSRRSPPDIGAPHAIRPCHRARIRPHLQRAQVRERGLRVGRRGCGPSCGRCSS